MAIDWDFISKLEGTSLKGYVPDQHVSRSGVTIGTGVDLGQLSAADIEAWPVDSALKEKLKPYCGYKNDDAAECLATRPLTVTQAECDQLNAAVQSSSVAQLDASYDATHPPPPKSFNDLPDRAQTVIASVAFQYGNLAARCPRFWAAAVRQDWPGIIGELENFGDIYPTRRHEEADYLRPILTSGRLDV